MPTVREPILHPALIRDLRPTQITVGMREGRTKRKSCAVEPDGKCADFLGKSLADDPYRSLAGKLRRG